MPVPWARVDEQVLGAVARHRRDLHRRAARPVEIDQTHAARERRLVDVIGDREEGPARHAEPAPRRKIVAILCFQIVEGSAELLVQLDALPLAGRYIGTIETSVRVP